MEASTQATTLAPRRSKFTISPAKGGSLGASIGFAAAAGAAAVDGWAGAGAVVVGLAAGFVPAGLAGAGWVAGLAAAGFVAAGV